MRFNSIFILFVLLFTGCNQKVEKVVLPEILDTIGATDSILTNCKMRAAFNYTYAVANFENATFKIERSSKPQYIYDYDGLSSKDSSLSQDNIQLLVDTNQKLSMHFKGMGDSLSNYFGFEPHDDYLLQAWPVFIINKSNDTILIDIQDGAVFMLREAMDRSGKWLPIEHWFYSTCGNSYGQIPVPQKQALLTKVLKCTGNYQTKIRFKLKHNQQIFYSNSFIGWINESHFVAPEKFSPGNPNQEEIKKVFFFND